jgi:hypothetical protein
MKDAVIFDVIANPVVPYPDTPGTDIDIGQLTALMGVFLESLKRFKYPSMYLSVQAP